MNPESGNNSAGAAVAFLKNWRPMECNCCGQLFGFQNRGSGIFQCLQGMEHGDRSAAGDLVREKFNGSTLQTTPKLAIQDTGRSGVVKALSEVDAVDGCPAAAFGKATVAVVTKVPDKKEDVRVAPKVAVPVPAPIVQTEAPLLAKAKSPQRFMFSDMKYSENLLKQFAPIKIPFAWAPTRYTVTADADEDLCNALQELVAEYAASATPSYQPVVDEVVVAQYEGLYYRARVSQVDGQNVTLVFIDFGDSVTCKAADVIPANALIFKYPVYGMIVKLKATLDSNLKEMTPAMEALIYDTTYLMEMNKKVDPPQPGSGEPTVRLWNPEKTKNLGEMLVKSVNGA